MSNNKQSSVEWLIGQLKAQYDIDIERLTVTDKAKAMHEREHELTAIYMLEYVSDCIKNKKVLHCQEAFKQYYNETFGKDE